VREQLDDVDHARASSLSRALRACTETSASCCRIAFSEKACDMSQRCREWSSPSAATTPQGACDRCCHGEAIFFKYTCLLDAVYVLPGLRVHGRQFVRAHAHHVAVFLVPF
jgi:hypothetical protein